MGELPRGTVTFLFTDIEGSTRLLHELGDAYADVLAEHRRVLREAFARNGGVEVDTQGDAFFVAFARASDALAAAREAQAGLDGPVKVRIGIHTGEPLLTDEGYVGMDVHRAARIAAAGHGGQVLVSQSTRELVGPDGLRDLGDHRLKDLAAAERLYQLGPDEFPPVKSLNRTNLPLQPTALVGRERELGELLELVRANRLVTLTGPGGSGKTRLALQVAAELVDAFPDGVWFVSLASLRDPDLVEPTVAQVLGATERLEDHLARLSTLLLLDNFEQLLAAAPLLAGVLARAPGVALLVTSREPLRLSGEREYPVPALAEPDAVELFAERVRAAKPGFEPDEHVAEICRRLDNLPLAVELAAARSNVLVPEQLLRRLDRRLPLLTSGSRDAPERQRTLRATIDWSYELLDDEEQQLFRRLAVFGGSFDLDAVEDVCGASLDSLGSLLDKSLLRQTAEGRFFLLETIREYAVERLAEDADADAVRRAHADHFVLAAEAARARHHEGYDALEADDDNGRSALDFLCAVRDGEGAARLALAFGDFWLVRGHVREGRRRVEEVLALEGVSAAQRLELLSRGSSLARVAGDIEAAAAHAEAAVALARELGDRPALAVALTVLGDAFVNAGDHDRGFSAHEEALAVAREVGLTPVPILTNMADAALAAGEAERAIEYSSRAVQLAGDHDRDSVEAIAAFNTGSALIQLGRVDEARGQLREALEAVLGLGYPELVGWCVLACAAVASGDDAGLLVGAADAIMDGAGVAFGPAEQRLRTTALAHVPAEADAEELVAAGRALEAESALSLARQYLD